MDTYSDHNIEVYVSGVQSDTILGLSLKDIVKIDRKLMVLGINLVDLLEFLDRDKVQLFAQMKWKIRMLEDIILNIKEQADKKVVGLKLKEGDE